MRRRAAATFAVLAVCLLTSGPAAGHPGHGARTAVDPTAFPAPPEPEAADSGSNDLRSAIVLVMLILTAVALAGLRETSRRSGGLAGEASGAKGPPPERS